MLVFRGAFLLLTLLYNSQALSQQRKSLQEEEDMKVTSYFYLPTQSTLHEVTLIYPEKLYMKYGNQSLVNPLSSRTMVGSYYKSLGSSMKSSKSQKSTFRVIMKESSSQPPLLLEDEVERDSKKPDVPLTLEVALLISHKVAQKFVNKSSLTAFCLHTMQEVNSYYKLPSFGSDLTIQLKSIQHLTKEEEEFIDVLGDGAKDIVNMTRVTNELNQELALLNKFVLKERISGDAIIYIRDGSGGGVAYVDGLCTRSNVGLVFFNGFHTARILAHELGHLVGLRHPEEACPEENFSPRNIMGGGSGFFKRKSKWSNCTKKKTQHLLRKRKHCLLETDHPAFDVPSYQTVGERWNATRQCQLMYGSEWFANMEKTDLCTALECRVPTSWIGHRTKLLPSPLEGTKCGKNARCTNGKCINEDTGEEVIKSRSYEWISTYFNTLRNTLLKKAGKLWKWCQIKL